MAWETRSTGRYYYRSVKRDGRVVKEYLGVGEAAQAAAAEIEARRQRREAVQNDVQNQKVVEQPSLDLDQVTDILLRASLLAAGFYRPDRHAWRCRRDSSNNQT
jgi:hypothetical protein